MINLTTCQPGDVTTWGQAFYRRFRENFNSLEEVSAACTQHIYNEFIQADGAPLFALVRIFRTSDYNELPPTLQGRVELDDQRWITLFGTTGQEPTWDTRQTSQNHQAIPIQAVSQAPMLRAAFGQLGLEGYQSEEGGLVILGEEGMTVRYFHVEQAPDSPHIPDQTEFVEPYQLQSVLGLGSQLRSGALGLLIAFTTTPVSSADAAKFAELSPYLMTVMASYDKPDQLWA